jgi:hypothetical protein
MQCFMPSTVLYAVCVYPFHCQHRMQEMQILDASHINGLSEGMQNRDHRGLPYDWSTTPQRPTNFHQGDIHKCAFPVEK